MQPISSKQSLKEFLETAEDTTSNGKTELASCGTLMKIIPAIQP